MSRDISDLLQPNHLAQPIHNPPMPMPMDGMDLGDIIALLFNNKWLILLFVLLAGLIGGLKAFVDTPIYHIDATVQVEEQSKSFPGLDDISEVLNSSTSSSTEIELLSSRSNLGQVVEGLNLRIQASPKYAPVVGAAIARRNGSDELTVPPQSTFDLLFGWLPESLQHEKLEPQQYGWGGEDIQVDRFSLENQSSVKNWSIQAKEQSSFKLYDDSDRLILNGTVGKTASVQDPDYGEVSIFISEMKANPDSFFNLTYLQRLTAIQKLKDQLSVKEKGKKTGIIELTIKHPDQAKAITILDLVASSYLRRNVEQKSQEAQQMLSFIGNQLPNLKSNLDAAETVLEEQKRAHGAVDLTMEAQSIIESSSEIEKQISLLQMESSELNRRYTTKHPRVVALQEKISYLRSKNAGLNGKLKAMPEVEWESVKLARDVKVANELYLMLLNKGQELKVAKAGTVGNVRIVDQAAARSLPTNKSAASIVGLALMIGFALGVGLAMLRRNLNKGLIDPTEIEQKTGLPVYAEVLESRAQRKIKIKKWRNKASTEEKLLARTNPKDPAIEALRSLRTYLQFAQMETDNNIIAISGSASGVGKSFIAANLSAVLAEAGKKVLLIDADIRKGYLHAYFNSKRDPGLTDLMTRKASLKDAIRVNTKRLHYLPTGTIPPNPAEVLVSRRFSKLLKSASKAYDIVIVDTPPVLAVTDPLIIAKQAGSLFMVLNAGEHHEKEIKEAVKRFEQAKIPVNGFILNQLPKIKHQKYSYGSKGKSYYQYSYE